MTGRASAASLVALVIVAYPAGVLVVRGLPRFPTSSECIRSSKPGHEVQAVFGRFARADAARPLLVRTRRAGFTQSSIQPDGCGFLQVVVQGIPDVQVGESFVREARTAGLRPTLELQQP